MLGATLSLANRYPVTNALEIFKCNPAPGVFGFRNQHFRNAMVYVGGETGFLAATLLQQTLGRLCAFRLQALAKACVAMAQSVHVPSRKHLAVAVCRDVLNAQVHAKKSIWSTLWWIWDIHNDSEVEGAIAVNQVGLSTNPLEACSLVLAKQNGDQDAAAKR
ncbi:hypothetical protein SAMN05421543_11527 [Alicyclobacillus macrosporangiidus]|uniref:Uncharacterized protein n=1 Tax=Alicyclobacillus macrosporangiidus TaxID=392015 RepID=A0A1I7KCH9_9BACL|nr:hypothetical protein SAMN05421543_11527 [Alicyclobacillus macrosporangiidus]